MDNLHYGIIGNCRSAALISKTGSIEWCCLPEFNSSSVFAKILDTKIGGSFEIITDSEYIITQQYIEDTSILVTNYSNGKDSFEINDFMHRYRKEKGGYQAPPEIVRYVKYISGKPVFRIKYDPKLEYALDKTISYVKQDFIVSLTYNEKFDSLFLYSSFDKQDIVDGNPITITEDGYFLLAYNEKIFLPTLKKAYIEFERTKTYWLTWSERTTSYKKYNKEISRSA